MGTVVCAGWTFCDEDPRCARGGGALDRRRLLGQRALPLRACERSPEAHQGLRVLRPPSSACSGMPACRRRSRTCACLRAPALEDPARAGASAAGAARDA